LDSASGNSDRELSLPYPKQALEAADPGVLGTMRPNSTSCPYCGSADSAIRYRQAYHKVDRSFGPFDLFECRTCGSLGTLNIPSDDRLAAFYRAYNQHRPQWYTNAAASSALGAQYRFYAQYLERLMPRKAATSWVDIGAGHGEIANLLLSLRPESSGCAIDIAAAAPALDGRVGYRSIDINGGDWVEALGAKFDFVYSVAVWEHVVCPMAFARESLSLVAPGGVLVMICPDYGSFARRALGRAWAYFEPGEHLSIPTREGALACVRRAATELGLRPEQYRAESSSMWVGYSIRYVLQVLRLPWLASAVPPTRAAPLPTGALATVITVGG